MKYNVFGGMLNLVQLQLIFVVTLRFCIKFHAGEYKNHVRNDAGSLNIQRYYCLGYFSGLGVLLLR